MTVGLLSATSRSVFVLISTGTANPRMDMRHADVLCQRCGHYEDSHEHYNFAPYCGVSTCLCEAFKRRRWWHDLFKVAHPSTK
jgi:hypothetical protein